MCAVIATSQKNSNYGRVSVTIHPVIIEHLMNARHELNIEISHLQIHTFNYGVIVALEILLAIAGGSWFDLIPGALFLAMMIINAVVLFKSSNSRQSLDNAISMLIGMEEEV